MCVVGWDDPGVQKTLSFTFLSNRKKKREGEGDEEGKREIKENQNKKVIESSGFLYLSFTHLMQQLHYLTPVNVRNPRFKFMWCLSWEFGL